MRRTRLHCFFAYLGVMACTTATPPADVGLSWPDPGDGPAGSVGRSAEVDHQTPVTVQLLTEASEVTPGETLRVGLFFRIAKGWHIFWQHPGDAGLATEVTWHGSKLTFSPLRWPAPQMFSDDDKTITYGYSGATMLTSVTQVPDDAKGPLYIEAKSRFLACQKVCAPGEITVRSAVNVGRQTTLAQPSVVAAFEAADHAPVLASSAPSQKKMWANRPSLALIQALLLAFLGGALLNLMPCVLPVLVLKVMNLAQQKRLSLSRSFFVNTLPYGVAVVTSMVTLSLSVLMLRAGGHAVGWGFQMQSPIFLAAVTCVLVLFAQNCFGAFEIYAVPSRLLTAVERHATASSVKTNDVPISASMLSSAASGVLAVLVATPCSAPLLGTATAFALAQPGWVVALIFATIGVGLATPFGVLTLLPRLPARNLRTWAVGARLKGAMGFSLLATALWLSWVMGRSEGVDAMAQLLALLLGVAIFAQVVGIIGDGRPFRTWLMLACEALCVGGCIAYTFRPAYDAKNVNLAQEVSHRPYSPAAVKAELGAGNPVLVDFTADWCLSCKYNELHVLSDPAVLQAMTKHHVTLLRADWTRRDSAILSTLKDYGRVGVPLVLIFEPGKSEAIVLPEILSVKGVLKVLEAMPP